MLLVWPLSVHEAHLKHAKILFSNKNTIIVRRVIQIQNRPVRKCLKCHSPRWRGTLEAYILKRRQVERIAAVLGPEDAEKEAVHAEKYNAPNNDS
jgi:hypothetical protein